MNNKDIKGLSILFHLNFMPFQNLQKRNPILHELPSLFPQLRYSHCRFKTEDIINHLFEVGAGTGSDLISININRGRDHGIPPYMNYRKMCNLYTTTRFSGLSDHSPELRELLSETYT